VDTFTWSALSIVNAPVLAVIGELVIELAVRLFVTEAEFNVADPDELAL